MKIDLIRPETLEKAGELALKQLDSAGYHLNQLGITDKVNRHNCIALLMTEDQRIRGEISRIQLKLGIQKIKARKAKASMGELVGQVAEWTPAPIEKPLLVLKQKLCS